MNLTPNETYRQSMKSTAEIQRDLDLIRLAYRERNMEPLNHRQRGQWLGYALLTVALSVPVIAALIFLSL